MKLYVMRHGPAEDVSPSGRDGDRALTPPGRDRVRGVAKALFDAGEAPFSVITSPLVRSLQTAEIVANVTDLAKRAQENDRISGAVEVRREMAPGGDGLGFVGQLLRDGRKRVMVVGHEPDLTLLLTELSGRPPEQGMMKAMVVGLKLTPTGPEVAGRGYTVVRRFILEPKALAWQRD